MKKIIFIFAAACCVLANAQTYQWAKGIGGAVGFNGNYAHCVTTDLVGNVYMTGTFAGTNVNFNPGLGPVTLTSNTTSGNDLFFAKYSASGNCIWAKGIVGAWCVAKAIVTDAAGNVYITGNLQIPGDFDPGPGVANLYPSGIWDIFFAKYDTNGNYLWAKCIGGSTGDWGMGIDLDAAGNVYITGRFGSANVDFNPGAGVAILSPVGSVDIFFAKYDTNGNYLWAKAVGNTLGDESNAISVDPTGNVYITGYFTGAVDFDPSPGTATLGAPGSAEIFFAKYDTNGNYIWARSIVGSGSGTGYSISADATGICLTGIFFSVSADFDPGPGVAILSAGSIAASANAMFIAKYDINGNYSWAKPVINANGRCISRSASGKIYVTGFFYQTPVDFDPGPGVATLTTTNNGQGIFMAKYDAAGNYVWAKAIDARGGLLTNYTDWGNAIHVDGADNVYIAGTFSGANVDFDHGPGTANFSTTGNNNFCLYLAKYAYCSTQATNSRLICPGSSYAINGHTYTAAGSYQDTLSVYTSFGCDSIVVTQLFVQPGVAISGNAVLCSGVSNTITATGAVTYTWSNGVQNPVLVVTPTNTTPYVVSATSSGGCTSSALIIVIPTPTLSISGKQTICAGEQVILTANGANSYSWSTGALTQSVLITPNFTSFYTVTGFAANTTCRSNQTVGVTISPCLGVNSYTTGSIQTTIYPNPAKTELFYTVNNNGLHSYSLADLSGRLLAEGEQSGNKARLDLGAYQPGIYILTITVGKNSKSTRFLIE